MRIRLSKAMAAALLLLAPVAGRGADTSFAYNGQLLDEKGHRLSQLNHAIVFRLYEQATGGDPLWSCTTNVKLSADGQFSVELAGKAVSGESLSTLFASKAQSTLYLGLTVDNDEGEISPRQKLLSVPKAVWASDCVGAKGNLVVTNACIGGVANTGKTTADSVVVTNALTCGSLVSGSMVVTNLTGNHRANLTVSGTVSGKGVIPIGGIVIWSGSAASIPNGWVLCNGQKSNGRTTPDLRDRFIVGAGSGYKVGAKGGEATHKLTVNEMPSHSHSYSFYGADVALAFKKNNYFYSQKEPYDLSNTAETESTGGNKAHENRPPYYALCYIMRVK